MFKQIKKNVAAAINNVFLSIIPSLGATIFFFFFFIVQPHYGILLLISILSRVTSDDLAEPIVIWTLGSRKRLSARINLRKKNICIPKPVFAWNSGHYTA